MFCERMGLKRFDPLVFNTITLSIIVQESGFQRKKKTKPYKLLSVLHYVQSNHILDQESPSLVETVLSICLKICIHLEEFLFLSDTRCYLRPGETRQISDASFLIFKNSCGIDSIHGTLKEAKILFVLYISIIDNISKINNL